MKTKITKNKELSRNKLTEFAQNLCLNARKQVLCVPEGYVQVQLTQQSSKKASKRETYSQKVPNIRKCVLTNERLNKTELIRIVRIDQRVEVDLTGKREGRGAYITPDIEIIQKAKQKNAFARALRMKVDQAIYDELLELVENDKGNS